MEYVFRVHQKREPTAGDIIAMTHQKLQTLLGCPSKADLRIMIHGKHTRQMRACWYLYLPQGLSSPSWCDIR